MALPLIPLAVGALTGGAGAIAGGMLSGKKEEVSNVYHAPYEHYAPTNVFAPSTAYSYVGATTIIDSPGASVSKKAEATATSEPYVSVPTITGATPSGGVDWMMLAAVAGVVIIGYGFVTTPNSRARKR